jgi:hypothetical protein
VTNPWMFKRKQRKKMTIMMKVTGGGRDEEGKEH